MSSNQPKVICFGEALIDRLGPLGGDPSLDNGCEEHFGGAPANVACGLARLGTNTAFIGCLGKDAIGESFKKLFIERGVNIIGLQFDKKRPSRIVLVSREISGERSFQGFRGDQGLGFSDQSIDIEKLQLKWNILKKQASWLVIGSIPLASKYSSEALLWIANEARNNNIKIALDINWRPTFWDSNFLSGTNPNQNAMKKISSLIEISSLIKVAKEEAIAFFQTEDPKYLGKSLKNNPYVIITNGANPVGWWIKGFQGTTKTICPPEVIDTTGAGDSFTAGLIHQIIRNPHANTRKDLSKIIQFAAACGALTCSGAGGISPQPSQSEVNFFLESI